MKIFARSLLCGLLLTGAVGHVAMADDAQRVSASDPHWDAHLALAKRFLEVAGARATFSSARDAAMNALPAQLHKAYPGLDDATIKTYLQVVREGFAQSGDDYFDHIAEIYARHFSEQELSDLIAFYQTDAGRKYVAELPGVVKDIADVQAEMMGKILRDFAQKLGQQTQNGETPAK